MEILGIGAGLSQFVEAGVDEAERMTGHLVGNSHETSPDWCAGTGATCEAPLSILIERHTGQGIGIGRDIGDAPAILKLTLD